MREPSPRSRKAVEIVVPVSPRAHIAGLMTQGIAAMDPSRVLQEYADTGSDEAFGALAEKYMGLVYSACLRQLKDRHLAEDACQAVFLLLSQKARGLRQDYLAGWLLTTARYACANIRKSEDRRQRREKAVAMNVHAAVDSSNDLLDFLDDALGHLKSGDREALVLRYLREQPVSEIAAALGISEEAARSGSGGGWKSCAGISRAAGSRPIRQRLGRF